MINWREIPLVRVIMPFITGILMAMFFPILNQMVTLFLLCFSFLAGLGWTFARLTFRYRWLSGIPLSILLFTVGYQWAFAHNELHNPDHFQHRLSHDVQIFTGVVTDRTEKADYIRLVVAIKQLVQNDSIQSVSGNMLVNVKKDTLRNDSDSSLLHTQPVAEYGDLVLIKSNVRIIEPPKNPEAVDFKKYWHFQNIHYHCFIQSDDIKLLASHQGNLLVTMALDWKSYFVSILKKYLTTENEFAVGTALLLGSKEAITDDIRNAYVETGAMHILAISGMHILLIFKQLEWLLNLHKTGSRRWRWVKTGILVLLIALFALLTGLGTSVLRAAVMASFLAIGKAMKRRVNIFNILAASALALLLWNPFWLMDIGFQLSFMAVIGITLFADKLEKVIFLPHKALRWVWSNVSIGLAAQLMVTPVSLYYFHQFPTYFWLTGLLAGAVADLGVISGVLLLVFDKIHIIAFFIGKILFASIWLMNNFIFIIHKLPFHLIEGIYFSFWFVVLTYLILSGVYIAFIKRKLRLLFYPLSIGILLSVMYAFLEVKSLTNKHLIIYHLPRISIVEIIDGKKSYRFYKKYSPIENSANKIKFATQNYHNALKINMLNKFDFNEYLLTDCFVYHQGYIRIGDATVLLLDKVPQSGLTLNNCFVVVMNNAKINMHHLVNKTPIRQVIFDGSNSRWKIEKWKKECVDLKLDYHDVAEKGAWIHKF